MSQLNVSAEVERQLNAKYVLVKHFEDNYATIEGFNDFDEAIKEYQRHQEGLSGVMSIRFLQSVNDVVTVT